MTHLRNRFHPRRVRGSLPGYLVAAVMGLAVLARPAQSRTITVGQDGTAEYNSIQPAIDTAAAGDTILVGPGVYRGPGNCGLVFHDKAIRLESRSGPERTVIDGSNASRGLSFGYFDNNIVVKGFSFVSCGGEGGGVVYSAGCSELVNCRIRENRRAGESVILIDGGRLRLTDTYLQSNCTLSSTGPVIMLEVGSVECYGCVFSGNAGDVLVTDYRGWNSSFQFCTFADNAGYAVAQSGDPDIRHRFLDCIIRDRIPAGLVAPSLNIAYSNVRGGWRGEGNIDADPVFALPGDYHLMAGSPGIDAGGVDCPACVDFWSRAIDGDGDGVARLDMGALEYSPFQTLVAQPTFVELSPEENRTVPPQAVVVRNTGSNSVQWTAVADSPWLQLSPSEGTLAGGQIETITIRAGEGLSPGRYEGVVDISQPFGPSFISRPVYISLVIPRLRQVPADYPDIQAAIDSAVDGDTILVAPGTYSGPGNNHLNFRGKSITVKSQSGASATLIDARPGSGEDSREPAVRFESGEPISSILDGFTIVNYRNTGIRCKSSGPTIRNCVIAADWNPEFPNEEDGVYCSWASPTFVGCEIRGNRSSVQGAWGVLSQGGCPVFRGCRITKNSSGFGGGIGVFGSILLENCTVSDNSGPGLYSVGDGIVGMVNCRVEGNTQRGVLCEQTAHVLLSGCLIAGNCGESGAGLCFKSGEVTVTNCTVAGNTFTGKGTPGLHWAGRKLRVSNCILRGDSARAWPALHVDFAPLPTILSSDIQNFSKLRSFYLSANWGDDVIDVDPIFVNPAGADGDPATWQDNDYHLLPTSPCADRGLGSAVGIAGSDLDGRPRVQFCHVDMGAYELDQFVDCNGNGFSDACDILDGVDSDCDGNFQPDSCQADSDADGSIDACDNCGSVTNSDQLDADQDGVGDACDSCPNTIPNAAVDGSGCPGKTVGDFDRDGDTDGLDVDLISSCMTGPQVASTRQECLPADLDSDSDVDQADFGLFQLCLSGTDLTTPASCRIDLP